MVTLAILASVVGIAVGTSDGLLQQARFDATTATLQSIERGLLGPPDRELQPGRPWVSGFVADIGRLPRLQALNAREYHVPELWSPEGLPPIELRSPLGDPEVRILTGWRGPYARLNFGTPSLRDGWDTPLRMLAADGTVAAQGSEVAAWVSQGADRTGGGVAYDEDRGVYIVAPAIPPRHVGVVPVRVSFASTPAASHAVLRLYGPRDGRVETLQEQTVSTASTNLTLAFGNVPIGHRVLRVYLDAGPPPTPETPFDDAVIRSPIIPLTVIAGGVPEILVEFE